MNKENKIEIFATGVRLEAVQCTINGIIQYRWVASSFEDESFLNGKPVLPIEYADNTENLFED